MSAIVRTEQCYPTEFHLGDLVTPAGEPDHAACPGGQHTPGVIGGWDCPCPCHRQPHELYAMATAQHPTDPDARAARYRELMIEAGHLIPGKPEPLPCGWLPS